MAEQVKSSWTYHPLDGQELIKWVFADAWAKLSQNGAFGAHLSYHNPTYRLSLEIKAYDASAKGVSNGANVLSEGKLETIEGNLAEFEPTKVSTEVVFGEPLTQPDRARELLDEGRYKTVTDSGVLVDKKVKKGFKEEKI